MTHVASRSEVSTAGAWLRAAHLGPSLAVTTVAGLIGVARDLPPATVATAVAAVLAGQLTIGWANDLLDADRDRRVGRLDKPLAAGVLDPGRVRLAVLAAGVACAALSLLLGWRSAVAHALGVGSGHLYNAGGKETAWSWLPYAVAFGSLPAVLTLAESPPAVPPTWMVATGALLGVAAHLLNVVPDLDDDARTGIRGLPHRLGAGWSRRLATSLLVAGSVTAVLGPDGAPSRWGLASLVVVAVLALVALSGRGRRPFAAAVAIALVDVVLLVVVGA